VIYSTSGNDPFPHRIQNQFRKTVEVEFRLKVPAMGLHRIQTQIQESRDILIRLALDQKLQNLSLTRREQVVAVLGAAYMDLTHVVFG